VAANKSNAIELNGSWYDALTGEQLAGKPTDIGSVQHLPVKAAPTSPRGHTSVDGIVSVNASGGSNQVVQSVPSRQTQHVAAHQPQASQTLMRRAVRPPSKAQPVSVQAQAPIQGIDVTPKTVIQAKVSSQKINPVRSQRAMQAPRSQSIDHFKAGNQLQTPITDLRAVQPQPAAVNGISTNPRPYQAPQRMQSPTPGQGRSTMDFVAARRTPRPRPQAARAAIAPPTPVAAPVQSEPTQPAQDIFEAALAHASSHTEAAPYESAAEGMKRKARKHRQVFGIVGSVAVFMLLAGFIAYQNRSNIQFQMASAKAGFAASMPNYKPNGYDLKKLEYSSGTVAALYATKTATSNQGAFSITQKKSNWDSQTLLESFVTTTGKDYQGYQANGRTVYVYGDSDATWVNGGIWYQIHANQSMPTDQLVKIAANL